MATTTNYSWTTPDDTALVKDGAAAIRSLGTAIDTTVFTNAGAAVAKATVDAKGDLIAGTADNTVARLAVGANGTTLVANSATATGLEWQAPAGSGLTLVKSQTIGSAVSSVTVTDAFSATYTNYRIVVSADSQSADVTLELKLGSTTTGYYTLGFYQNFGTATVNGFQSSNSAFFYSVYGGTNGTSGVIEILKPQVAARTSFTSISASPTTTGLASVYNGFLNDATQYTAFTLTPNSGTITGGQVRVYGYQNS
jgi:hypothetical protein